MTRVDKHTNTHIHMNTMLQKTQNTLTLQICLPNGTEDSVREILGHFRSLALNLIQQTAIEYLLPSRHATKQFRHE